MADQPMAQEQLRNLYESNPDYAIFTLDPQGYITTWSHGAVRMKQYTAQEAIGHHFSMLYPEEDQENDEPMQHLRDAAAQGVYRGSGIRIRKNGQPFVADVMITPLYDGGKLIGFSKLVADVSEQGGLRLERDQSRKEVKRLQIQQGMRERFVSALTHDLRNPLAAVRSALELLLIQKCDQEMHLRLAKVSLTSLDRVDKMISDLLDANRITSGKPIPLHIEAGNLEEIARETVKELTLVHGDRLKLQSEVPVPGSWDRQALKRVIENLVVNAIKYGDPVAPITLSLSAAGGRATLRVHNLGNPISSEDQKTLFQQFRRAKSADHGQRKGWGLGLTLVRGIVKAHGGTVDVESDARRGTTFTVELPMDNRQSQLRAS